MRMLSTRNCSGRITQTAYLSQHKPRPTLLQLFASEWMCINACVMALSGNVRYQFVCQMLVFSFVCWLVPHTVASHGDGKRLRSWTSASGPGVHRSSHLNTGVYKHTDPKEDRLLSDHLTNDSSFSPEASFHASYTRSKLILPISARRKENIYFFLSIYQLKMFC